MRTKCKKYVLVILLLLAVATPCAATVLNVPQKYQEQTQWCWAGVSQAILEYFGIIQSQAAIAAYGTAGLNTTNYLSGEYYDSSLRINRRGVSMILSNFAAINSIEIRDSLFLVSLTDEIDNNRPPVIGWWWDNGGGHVVVARGVEGSTVYLIDPWYGPTINTYDWVKRGGSHTWASTLKLLDTSQITTTTTIFAPAMPQMRIAAGSGHTVGLKLDGTAVAIGANYYGPCDVSLWNGISQIAAGSNFTVGLTEGGMVVAKGQYYYAGVSSWWDIVQVAAGESHTVGLKSDGTVIATGTSTSFQCDVGAWTDISQIAAGTIHTVGLKTDGRAIAAGFNEQGQCNVDSLTGLVQVAAGWQHTVGLKSDGTVVAKGSNYDGTHNVGGWFSIIQVAAGWRHTVGLKSNGTVVATGDNARGQCNVLSWTDIVQVAAGDFSTVGLKSDGTVVAVGNNEFGQCNVSGWNLNAPQPTTTTTQPTTTTTIISINGWNSMASGTTKNLYGVWGNSGNDVFAVGGSFSEGGIILHYNGTEWAAMPSGNASQLYSIWGSSSSNVFAAGSGGEILHYNGISWSRTWVGSKSRHGVWGSSENDVFAVGDDGSIIHFDGSSWAEMSSGTTEMLSKVWGSSGNDVFAVGLNGTILHYDGTSWSDMTSNTADHLNDVWGRSGDDVYAVGWYGNLLHYDGISWSTFYDLGPYLLALWGSPGHNLFAVGANGGIEYYNGSSWSSQYIPDTSYLNKIWGASSSSVFVVGDNGLILHYAGNGIIDDDLLGSISGRVTNIREEGLGAMAVNIITSGYPSTIYASATTASDGTYTVSHLAPGNYYVCFERSPLYFAECYNDKPDQGTPDAVTVTAGNITSDINAQLADAGVITGHITDTNGRGLNYVSVVLYDLSGNAVKDASSDVDGNYSMGGLPTENYKVFFDFPGSAPQWYNGKPDSDSADTVAVTAGQTTVGIDAQLVLLYGSISGRVTNAEGVGLENIRIEIYDENNVWVEMWPGLVTAADGTYSYIGLWPGKYKVVFREVPDEYLEEWYSDKPDFASADFVTVVANQTTANIDVQLAHYWTLFGGISGRVTNAEGVGLENIWIEIYYENNVRVEMWPEIVTAADGTYSTYSYIGLWPGNYKVVFHEVPNEYLEEWYDNAQDFASATPVMVRANELTPDINAQLAGYYTLFGAISGRVFDETGTPLENYRVSARNVQNSMLFDAYTDASGEYQIGWLEPGEYRVFFEGQAGLYLDEWYAGAQDFETATPVMVYANDGTAEINAQLEGYYTLFGAIRGRVTDENGTPLENYRVMARNVTSFAEFNSYTDATGAYEIGWLEPGEYRVFFEGQAGLYLDEWYADAPDFETAMPVMVHANDGITGINVQLAAFVTTTTTVPVDDPDSCEDALPLAFDIMHNGSIGPAGDWDYFMVEAPATGYLRVVLMGGDGLVAHLKEGSCNDISSGETEFSVGLLERRVLAGTYYIAVNHGSPTETGIYDLTVYFQTQDKDAPKNVLLMLDNSGSMNYPAYPDPYNPDVSGINNGTVLTNATFVGSTTNYYGYFDPAARYSYSYSSNKFVRDETGPWDGNFLNWVSMRRIDVFRKALMGGKRPCESCYGLADLKGENPAQASRYWQTYYNGANVSPYEEAWYGVRDGFLYVKATTDPLTGNNPWTNGDRFLITVEKDATLEPDAFCDDGNPCGVLQKAVDSARWGTLWFDTSNEGGRISNSIAYGNMESIITDFSTRAMSTSTPLAETLYTAIKYFQQSPALPPGYSSSALPAPCTPGGSTDPFYNFGQPLPNAKSFVLMLTDGVPGEDKNIPAVYQNYDGDTNAATRTYAANGSDYLDDVALYSHSNDLRADLEGSQTMNVNVVYAFGKDPMAKTLLMETAMNGGFKDINGNFRPDGYLNDGNFTARPAAARLEWDADGDGIPDNFFEAKDGFALETQLRTVINRMSSSYEDNCTDGIDNDGDGLIDCADPDCQEFDNDNDGYTVCTGDCDEHNAAVHPGVTEVCNGIDDNCDGQTDEGTCITSSTTTTIIYMDYMYFRDKDGDGFGNSQEWWFTSVADPGPEWVTTAGDCNDNNSSVHPGVTEVCNGIDDNCDGQVDEGCTTGNDINGDGYADILVQDAAGSIFSLAGKADGSVDGLKRLRTQTAKQLSVAGFGDINGDGYADVVVQDAAGSIFSLAGKADGSVDGLKRLRTQTANQLSIAGFGDINGDGYADILVQDAVGSIFSLAGKADGSVNALKRLRTQTANQLSVAETGDINGDGYADILVQDAAGSIFSLAGKADGSVDGLKRLRTQTANQLSIAGIGDINGDGYADIMVQDTVGSIFSLAGKADGSVDGLKRLRTQTANQYSVAGAMDINGDGYADVVIQDAVGSIFSLAGKADGSVDGLKRLRTQTANQLSVAGFGN